MTLMVSVAPGIFELDLTRYGRMSQLMKRIERINRLAGRMHERCRRARKDFTPEGCRSWHIRYQRESRLLDAAGDARLALMEVIG